MFKSGSKSQLQIRELTTVPDLERVLTLEKEVWEFSDADVTPLALAVATQKAGSLWLGAFDRGELIGFAFAFPSLHHESESAANGRLRVGFHSHTLAVRSSYRDSGIGFQLKLAQREKALALGVAEMSWTFDPLRSRNAHLNFSKLGVISTSYRVDFYGPQTSSPCTSIAPTGFG